LLEKYALKETAPNSTGQLFDLANDPGETTNLFFKEAAKRAAMQKLLATLVRKDGGRSAPTNREPLGIERIPRLDKR
jgi:arylsulfatase A